MTKPARQIAQLVPVAGETTTVGVAAGPAHPMAADAELLARAAVTSGARDGIEPRGQPMLTSPARCREPTGWVGTTRRGPRRHPRRSVAIDARIFGVARRAEPGLSARFFRVVCTKAGTMQSREPHLLECETRGERRHGHPVAAGTGSLAVARGAEVARAGGAHAVLSDPVSLVD